MDARPWGSAAWADWDSPEDTVCDCRHGCNGDCVTSGSDVCTFVCHPA